jgi:hypothetical protein
MKNEMIRKGILALVLAGATFAIACGGGVEGTYRDPTGGITAQFKGGKAYLALGVMDVEGTYTIDGNKIVARGDFGPMIGSPITFTVNSDGTIQGPKDSLFPRLEKVK